MTTLEMVTELTKYPDRIYYSRQYNEYVLWSNGYIVHSKGLTHSTEYLFNLNRLTLELYDWQQVTSEQKEVDFIEAITSGKKIKLKHEHQYSGIGVITNDYSYAHFWLLKLGGLPRSIYNELIQSKWLIQEEDDE